MISNQAHQGMLQGQGTQQMMGAGQNMQGVSQYSGAPQQLQQQQPQYNQMTSGGNVMGQQESAGMIMTSGNQGMTMAPGLGGMGPQISSGRNMAGHPGLVMQRGYPSTMMGPRGAGTIASMVPSGMGPNPMMIRGQSPGMGGPMGNQQMVRQTVGGAMHSQQPGGPTGSGVPTQQELMEFMRNLPPDIRARLQSVPRERQFAELLSLKQQMHPMQRQGGRIPRIVNADPQQMGPGGGMPQEPPGQRSLPNTGGQIPPGGQLPHLLSAPVGASLRGQSIATGGHQGMDQQGGISYTRAIPQQMVTVAGPGGVMSSQPGGMVGVSGSSIMASSQQVTSMPVNISSMSMSSTSGLIYNTPGQVVMSAGGGGGGVSQASVGQMYNIPTGGPSSVGPGSVGPPSVGSTNPYANASPAGVVVMSQGGPSPGFIQTGAVPQGASPGYPHVPSVASAPQSNKCVPSVEASPAAPGSVPTEENDKAYKEKIKELQPYLEPLKRLIESSKEEDAPKETLTKHQRLAEALEGKTMISYPALLRCEEYLLNKVLPTKPEPEQPIVHPLLEAVAKVLQRAGPGNTSSLDCLKRNAKFSWGDMIPPEKRIRTPPLPTETEEPANTASSVSSTSQHSEFQVPVAAQREIIFLESRFRIRLDRSIHHSLDEGLNKVDDGDGKSIDESSADIAGDNTTSPSSNNKDIPVARPGSAASVGKTDGGTSEQWPNTGDDDDDDVAHDTDVPQISKGFKDYEQRPMRINWGRVHVVCDIEDLSLPAVPPLRLSIPKDYPSSSPHCDVRLSDYDSYPFLESIKRSLRNKLAKLGSSFTLTALLDSWESSVRQATAVC